MAYAVRVKRHPLDISRKVIAGFVAGELYAVADSILSNGFHWRVQGAVLIATAVAYFKTEVFPTA